MSTATEPRAAESPVASPAPPASKVPPATTGTPAGPPPATLAPGYRSIADGELATPWSLGEYFGSLNTVMRLPPKMRKRVEAIEKRTGIKLPDIQLPKGVVAAAFLLAIGVFVVRPLMGTLGGAEEAPNLVSAYGVWEAGTGKYAGRMFELGERSIAFRTSSESPDYTWHKITDVRYRAVTDSTLFTVTYEESGKPAEFAFWYVNQAGKTVIRLQHTPEVTWIKTPYEPIARPPV
ncbi:MAG: hypothetical protein IPI38_00600 [Gemmatimonadetes bacterium]|nr:hypothetical protein [Gemmatimonadota bacterium]MBK7348351.1 hypothetical protein [Gemmatimonadota bacterium]MBK7713922.1 hypothetical protein [Gemmatimonadota bacterium]MBK9068974.1 hypothetical protein [Gemmatimonadota bacterium]